MPFFLEATGQTECVPIFIRHQPKREGIFTTLGAFIDWRFRYSLCEFPSFDHEATEGAIWVTQTKP
jgi:hypothetical protein